MKYTHHILGLMAAITFTTACKYNKQGDPAVHYDHETPVSDSTKIPNHVERESAYDSSSRLPAPGKIDSTALSGSLNEDFVNKAAAGSLLERTLGELALQRAANTRVKSFGAMMIADHGKINEELKAIAGAKRHTLPTTLSEGEQKLITSMNKKHGGDFDNDYMKKMISTHERMIRLFEQTNGTVSDTTVKAFALRQQATLRKHLDSARAINRDL